MCALGGLRGNLLGTVPYGDFQAAAIGGMTAVAVVLRAVGIGLIYSLISVLMLVLLQAALKRKRLAWLAWGAVMVLTSLRPGHGLQWMALSAALISAAWAVSVNRGGLLAGIVAYTVFATFNEEYVTVHLGAWYAGVTVAGLFLVALLLTWGVGAALRGTRAAEAG